MKLNQKGFGAVEIILIIVIVGVLGFVGYRAYQLYTSDPETGAEQSKYDFKEDDVTDEQKKENFVEISQWGARFPVPSSTKLSYTITTEKDVETVHLHAIVLDQLGEYCKSSKDTFGILFRQKTEDKAQASPPTFITKEGEYYYYYMTPQSSCSDENIELQEKVAKDHNVLAELEFTEKEN